MIKKLIMNFFLFFVMLYAGAVIAVAHIALAILNPRLTFFKLGAYGMRLKGKWVGRNEVVGGKAQSLGVTNKAFNAPKEK